jgi:hypothetical protein
MSLLSILAFPVATGINLKIKRHKLKYLINISIKNSVFLKFIQNHNHTITQGLSGRLVVAEDRIRS